MIMVRNSDYRLLQHFLGSGNDDMFSVYATGHPPKFVGFGCGMGGRYGHPCGDSYFGEFSFEAHRANARSYLGSTAFLILK